MKWVSHTQPTPWADSWRDLWRKDPERASRLCDSIVRSRPVPDRLLAILRVTPVTLEEVKVIPRTSPILTEREVSVVQCAADGLTIEQTSKKLFLATNTVKWHRKHAQTKLGARTPAHTVALALRDGKIQFPQPDSMEEVA